ncbi:B-cell CLL/lymphoma 6 member B protein Bcl6-associated zinc finger protein [Larimichthys crocea]|uniref:B-cell CLL/lymphoma 6 member B protein Bcl6-associated zinc finger protein n=1 Tax=Larimichthys crocea TaxID=215358 RepID=A0A6G0HEB5_LARCR|nr:B-cell CLL/lymphoma 6 member B protein Bcl6-associated zinc finger protein [Larimichthys crocea]
MSMMEVLEGYRVDRVQEMRAPAPAEGYVKEFTRHSNDVLLNLNELRHRNILTDTTLVVGNIHLRAHCAVLVACSGFFYSLYSHRVLLQGRGGSGDQLMTVSLPDTLDPSSISLLLDFMYTSRLPLTPSIAPGVLSVATYLQMDHVADTCRDFMQLHCRENMSARHPQLELDSRVSVASVAPKGGDLPNLGPQRLLPTAVATRVPAEVGGSLKPGAFPTCQPRSKAMKGEPESPLMGTPIPFPDSPARSSCQPNSPAESNTCNKNLVSDVKSTPDPKACNWKKYKYIVLNPLCAATTVKEEEMEEPQSHTSPTADRMGTTPTAPTEAWSGEVPGQIDRQGQASCYEGSGRAPPLGPPPSLDHPTVPSTHKEGTDPESAHQHAIKRENYYVPYCYSGNIQGTKTPCSGDKPYRCNVCGAQFNRPANLKTHSRIHSGEKPYRCDTCGARFVQVAHLRAHVLIHTGEKPYPCHTCGTRFRHLQTLKSHLRIHTGEKPYTCEKCDLHFRHKSQLRLHLRQKHGAVTNTKIRYKVLTEPYQPILQAC